MAKGPRPLPVKIRGVIYPSQKAAAEALGVAQCTITTALAKGRQDFLGIGAKRAHRRNEAYKRQATSKAVQIGNQIWPSRAAAARALGISRTVLCDWLDGGKIEKLAARAMASTIKAEGHKPGLPKHTDQDAASETMLRFWQDRKKGLNP